MPAHPAFNAAFPTSSDKCRIHQHQVDTSDIYELHPAASPRGTRYISIVTIACSAVVSQKN